MEDLMRELMGVAGSTLILLGIVLVLLISFRMIVSSLSLFWLESACGPVIG